jgi:anti-anti-sigma factor
MRPGAIMVATASTETPKFSATADCAQRTLVVDLVGTIDFVNKTKVDELLSAVHRAAREHAAQEVIVDFRKLEFMNSSCLKIFVAWIDAIVALPPADQYRVVFVPSREIAWQKRSLLALSCLAAGIVSIDT